MKNKHLVLLFLVVLTLGLFRYLPVRYRSIFRGDLIQVDTAVITKCVVLLPQQPELALERTETGWAADQNGRVAPLAGNDVTALLETLAGIRSLRRVKTGRVDTLGFTADKIVKVQVFNGNRLVEHFELGHEILMDNQPATYLQLPLHNGVYLVQGHLRRLFTRSLDDFRPKSILMISPDAVRSIGIFEVPEDTLFIFQKDDSLHRWGAKNHRYSLRDDSVQNWLGLLLRLNGSPFADNFDESQEQDTRVAAFYLKTTDSAELVLQFYALKPPNIPEDFSGLRRQRWHDLPVYVVHSSQNPMNYFAVMDTNLVRFLCSGLWQMPEPDKKINQ